MAQYYPRPCLTPLFLVIALTICMAISFPGVVSAATTDDEVQINFSADQMDVDRELGIVTARGNVEVVYQDRTMTADTISYNQKSDVLTASGNIVLLEPLGDVIFSEHIEIDGDFKNGIIENILIILSDRSRIAANGARRTNEDMDLRKAVYSPCDLCEDDPSRPPLWQLKAVKVFHDKSQQTVEYTDAWLEVAGIPVLYTPYLSHPDPTVKRKSGFLVPTFGSSTQLGATIKTPYFWNISPQNDLTVTPAYYGDQGAGLSGEYRHLFHDGEIDMIASLVDNSGTILGHVDGSGRFDIDHTWRWGFDAWASSEDTYLRRYGFRSDQVLKNDLYIEGFRKRNYARAETIYFQSMEAGEDDSEIPFIAPLLTFQHVGEPDPYGGHTMLDASYVSLMRDDGVDSHRLSLTPGWESNHISNSGDVYRLALTLDTDLYFVQDHTVPGNNNPSDDVTGRVFPQAQLDWSKPYSKGDGNITQIIEPKVSLIMAPNGSNPSEIPNEDSQEFEFDETHLFGNSKLAGHDRVENGTRVDYGMHWGVYGKGKTTAFIGQSYRFRKDNLFPENSGLENNLSDVVAKLEIEPSNYMNLTYRSRIGKSSGEIKRSEINISAGAPLFTFNARYLFFARQEDSEFGGREDLNLGFKSQIDKFWRAAGSMQYDIADEDTRSINLGLTYEDECLVFNTSFSRTLFKDRDLEPDNTILFTINFKTLGGLSTNVF